jgi:hypothetical protein
VLLTILFYFDHNVSSLIAQGTEFPLKKPAGFHWDIFLLGITTAVSGFLGIPAPKYGSVLVCFIGQELTSGLAASFHRHLFIRLRCV